MTAKFDRFLEALSELCREHAVQLTVSDYDAIQIWDLAGDDEPVYANGIEDRTAGSPPPTSGGLLGRMRK